MNQIIEEINNSFDKIYLICLKENFQKREPSVRKNLDGIDYTIIWGVNGKTLNEEEISLLYDDTIARLLLSKYILHRYGKKVDRAFTRGEIGCALSHLSIYKEIVENNYERVLILEDDAMINPRFVHKLSDVRSFIPDDYDLIYWGYRWYDSESSLSRLFRLVKNAVSFNLELNKRHPTPYNKYFCKAGYHAGTHAYSINRKLAEHLIAMNTPVKYCADQILSRLTYDNVINSYVVVPQLFIDDQIMESTIII